jgi:hypothetical protein
MLDRKYLTGVLTGTGLGFLIANWIVVRVGPELGGLSMFAAGAMAFGGMALGAWLANSSSNPSDAPR